MPKSGCKHGRVSILVLMDGVLRAALLIAVMLLSLVSILVLMDGVLREKLRGETTFAVFLFQSLF